MKLTKGIIGLILIAVITTASVLQLHGTEVHRKLTKTSTTAKGGAVNNKFGNITVKHWDKQEVSVIVTIKAKASKEEIANEMAKSITIKFEETGGILSASTSFPSNLKTDDNKKISVDYEVTLPDNYTLDIKNMFGNITFPETIQKGKTDTDIKYGNIYGGNFAGILNIDSEYGSMSIDKIVNGKIICGYDRNCVIKEAGKINVKLAYSGLKFDSISDLTASAEYSDITIGVLKKSILIDKFGFSKIFLNGASADVSKISITGADYSSINLVLDKIEKISPDLGHESFTSYDIKEITPQIIGEGGTPVIIRGNFAKVKLRK